MPTVLHLTASGPTLWAKSGDAWKSVADAGSGPVWVVTDLSEDTLVEIAVPRIFGADRRRLIARQLTNRFPETRYRVALPPRSAGGLMQRLAPPVQTLAAIDPPDRIRAALQPLGSALAGVWSSTMLLAQMGQHSAYPPHVLMVLQQPSGGLRMVFLKNRSPVLTRLVAANSPTEQSAEIFRTLRHLENTRVIERGIDQFSAVLMGASQELADLLVMERVELVAPARTPGAGSAQDWLEALWDRVCKTPSVQLAPLEQRAVYVASRVSKGAFLAAAVCCGIAALVLAIYVDTIVSNLRQQADLQVTSRDLTAKQSVLEASVLAFGATPAAVRKVLTVQQDEIEGAPDFPKDVHAIAKALSHVRGVQIKNLQWRVLDPTEAACGKDVVQSQPRPIVAPGTAKVQPNAGAPVRVYRVELQLDMDADPDEGLRQRQQRAVAISSWLESLAGLEIIRDPVHNVRDKSVSAALGPTDAGSDAKWCALLKGVRP